MHERTILKGIGFVFSFALPLLTLGLYDCMADVIVTVDVM